MIYNILLYVTLIAGCIPLLILVTKGGIFKTHTLVLPLVFLLAFSSIYECVVSMYLQINIISWYWIHSVLEFLAVMYLFKGLLKQRPKWFLTTFLGLFILVYYCSIRFYSKYPVFVFKGINKAFITLFVLICSFLWIKEIFDKKEILKLYQDSNFYLVMGLFFYYSTTISLFVLSNYLYVNKLYMYDYWLVNIIASLILRIVISISVWKMN